MWLSPFALRVEWALKLKGIEYEYIDEDLSNKTPQLLHFNPVYKKIPVLVHGGKPIPESLIIIEYIDEVWKHINPLFAHDPYEKAMARFWARYSDDKCTPALLKAFSTVGETQKGAIEEAKECLRTLEGGLKEGGLKGRKFFGGETIGFVDIVTGWIAYWVPMIEEIMGVTIVDEGELPLMHAWFRDYLQLDVVKERLPPRDKVLQKLRDIQKRLLG
ncbi:hypothetical protein QJS04_geneDACA017689 [Acorus gramineus]|uniref:glutathione transferase n=1 Tax=Acorus gramineus TaxID=55184 RepID=A0AAV9BVT8_ACOGR|nr:hypothetical protein QJS04_geneDACA017689 [Acorus gramineus]